MDSKVRTDFPRQILNSVQEQIKLADTKAAWIFSVLSVGTGALITKTSRIDWNIVNKAEAMVLIAISTILIVLAFKNIIRVIYPRITKGNSSGMIYFGDIVSQQKKDYVKKGLSIKEEEIVKQLYEQSHVLSSIAEKKFKTLKTALLLTIIAIILIAISILLI